MAVAVISEARRTARLLYGRPETFEARVERCSRAGRVAAGRRGVGDPLWMYREMPGLPFAPRGSTTWCCGAGPGACRALRRRGDRLLPSGAARRSQVAAPARRRLAGSTCVGRRPAGVRAAWAARRDQRNRRPRLPADRAVRWSWCLRTTTAGRDGAGSVAKANFGARARGVDLRAGPDGKCGSS